VNRHKKIVVGSRTDPYSLLELERVISSLRDYHPDVEFCDFRELGLGRSVRKGKRTKWIWRDISLQLGMLRDGKVDLVVSQGDVVPVNLGKDFTIPAVLKRGNPFDVLISKYNTIFDDHPPDATIAISGMARKGQLLYYRPDLVLRDRNCNKESLEQLISSKEIDGVVTSAGEAEAFGVQEKVVEVFTPSISVPEAGQGCNTLIVRAKDRKISKLVRKHNHTPSRIEFDLERKLLKSFSSYEEGTIAAMASAEDEEFKIEAAIVSPDGSRKVSSEVWGCRGEEVKAINNLKEEMFYAGGRDMITK
jgi:porphobilinogen deaminase